MLTSKKPDTEGRQLVSGRFQNRPDCIFQWFLLADTVEKLCFEISGDFFCDLSVISYSRYEGVVEVVSKSGLMHHRSAQLICDTRTRQLKNSYEFSCCRETEFFNSIDPKQTLRISLWWTDFDTNPVRFHLIFGYRKP